MIQYGKYDDVALANHYQGLLNSGAFLAEIPATGSRVLPTGKTYNSVQSHATNGRPAVAEVIASAELEFRGMAANTAAIEQTIINNPPEFLAGSTQPIRIDSVSRDTDEESAGEDRLTLTTISISAQWSEYNS